MLIGKLLEIWHAFQPQYYDKIKSISFFRNLNGFRQAKPLPDNIKTSEIQPLSPVYLNLTTSKPCASTDLNGTKTTVLELELCWLENLQSMAPERSRRILNLTSEVVSMEPLDACSDTLSTIDVIENTPHQPWHQNTFTSCSPSLFELDDAIVHGAVGIIALSNFVVAESLWHTDTDRHRYGWQGPVCELSFDHIQTLKGRHASILTGAAESYWHAVFDATARLGLITGDIWSGIDGLLIPATGVRQKELVDLFGVPDHVEVKVVTSQETLKVETLILPSSVHIMFEYHPTLVNTFYDRLICATKSHAKQPSRRIIIDRRASGLRTLLNETSVINALIELGFEAIRLEDLPVADQVSLFRDAEIIVAPHGAGLTNIGFAHEGSIIIELMMDAYLNWCYRRIAAIRKLEYHCVIGRSSQPVSDTVEVVHWRTWTVDVQTVQGIVQAAILKRSFSSRSDKFVSPSNL